MKILQKIEEFKSLLGSEIGRILSLDLGTKKIGVAICDETRSIITPKLVLKRQGNQKDFEKIAEIILDSKVKGLVMGMPTNLDDSPTGMTYFVLRFSENFVKFCQEFTKIEIPIMLWDERLSSFEARNKLSEVPNHKHRNCDDIAATIILEHFLNDLRNC